MFYFPILKYANRQWVYRDPDNHKHLIVPILKNGSTTLNTWKGESRWDKVNLDTVDREEQYEITLFIRDPIERFWSAASQVFKDYLDDYGSDLGKRRHVPNDSTWVLASACMHSFFIDPHLLPQFFTLLKCYDHCPNAIITFHSHKDMPTVLGTTIHKNVTRTMTRREGVVFMEKLGVNTNKIKQAYHPDQIMWNEFVGKTLHFDEVRERFKQEADYFRQYTVGRGF